MLGCQIRKISAKLLAGVFQFHARINRCQPCKHENCAAKVLRVPRYCLQSPQDAGMPVGRVQETLMFIEDRENEFALALEHMLKGREQRVGSCLGEQG